MSWHCYNDIQSAEYGIVGSNRQLPSDADSVSVISDDGNSSDTEVITDTNTLAVDTNVYMVDDGNSSDTEVITDTNTLAVDTNVYMVDINASAVDSNSVAAATVAVTECDIGKLLLSGINVQRFNREHIMV